MEGSFNEDFYIMCYFFLVQKVRLSAVTFLKQETSGKFNWNGSYFQLITSAGIFDNYYLLLITYV